MAAKKEEFGCLVQATSGVVFLGTPHCGSNTQPWGELLVFCWTTCGMKANNALLKDLNEESENQRDFLHEFTALAIELSIPLACFFEQETTDVGISIFSKPIMVRYLE